jgi:hypothetical protein
VVLGLLQPLDLADLVLDVLAQFLGWDDGDGWMDGGRSNRLREGKRRAIRTRTRGRGRGLRRRKGKDGVVRTRARGAAKVSRRGGRRW